MNHRIIHVKQNWYSRSFYKLHLSYQFQGRNSSAPVQYTSWSWAKYQFGTIICMYPNFEEDQICFSCTVVQHSVIVLRVAFPLQSSIYLAALLHLAISSLPFTCWYDIRVHGFIRRAKFLLYTFMCSIILAWQLNWFILKQPSQEHGLSSYDRHRPIDVPHI